MRSTSAISGKHFPKGFRWGAATAGYQIEGNNTNADLWLLENVQPTAFAERSGDACDSLHRYEEDIALLAGLGLNTYRFSIEWSRIEPDRGYPSIAELDYYKRVIDCCHKHNVAPAVTFLHTSAPRWFAEAGGFLNPESPKLFADFCSTAAKALAADMAYAFTINEPEVTNGFRAIMGGAGDYFKKHDDLELASHAAAAKAAGSAQYVTLNHPDYLGMTPQLIAAHEQGYAAIKAENASLPVSVTLNILDFEPSTEGSLYEDVRKKAYGEWLDTVRRTGDFAAVQIYRQIRLPGPGKPLPSPPPLTFVKPDDMYGNLSRPEAMRNGIEYVYFQVQKPIFVTENGLQTDDDAARVEYIDLVLASLHDAIASGIPVIGYLHWSLMDNFEWEQGYKPKYGLYSVDRTTFKRTAKPSAGHYGAIARRNAL
jgi:beta-glucosidase